jgi:ABC-type phosphate/phosphonate transport system substrate-binding protein
MKFNLNTAPNMTTRSFLRRLLLLAAAPGVLVAALMRKRSGGAAETETLVVAVMDPLAKQLSCPCMPGYAQRDYDQLGVYLSDRLGLPVRVVYGESFEKAVRGVRPGQIALVVGGQSMVKSDLHQAGLNSRPLCLLTDQDGRTTITGLFVVKSGDKAKSLADLQGRTILFGPADSVEKNATALAALKAAGVTPPATIETRGSCSSAATEVQDSAASTPSAAVVSSYRFPLLEACGELDRGSLRVIARTSPVPFVTVFATDAVKGETEQKITAALLAAHSDARLLKAIESKDGFVGLTHLDLGKPLNAAGPVPVEARFRV